LFGAINLLGELKKGALMSLSKNILRIALLASCLAFLLEDGSAQTTVDEIDPWPDVYEINSSYTILIRIQGLKTSGDSYSDSGSGVIVGANSYILTVNHLFPDKNDFEEKEYGIYGVINPQKSSEILEGIELEVLFQDPQHDLALLKCKNSCSRGSPINIGRKKLRPAQNILVMGYPKGGLLRPTGGMISPYDVTPFLATDARVEGGNSGGPVFDRSGNLIGILDAGEQILLHDLLGSEIKESLTTLFKREGRIKDSLKEESGLVGMGLFIPISVAMETIGKNYDLTPIAFGESPPPPTPVDKIQFAYSFEQIKDDHPVVLGPHTKDNYEKSFNALPGYKIVSADVVKSSESKAKLDPLKISSDGKTVTLRFALTSGPLIDQWRGWLMGNIVTTQERENK